MHPSPALSILFRPDLHVLIVRWLREISQHELQQGYQEALATARHHGARCWLVDSRRRALSDEQMADWLATSFLPTLSQDLGSVVYVACLVSATWQDTGGPAAPLVVLAQRQPLPAQGYHLQLFGDEGTAMQWLHRVCTPTVTNSAP
ncbi:hypothetical protein MUN84_22385 [Hymenobacter sp. 5516J-16]|uniref:hypothetical protein n=1 Tax=Hymenobacter sp. 5516J-16 TaxID=2932253 RepID=UPI001FD41FBE|nr:hypothetical protein [Hymenobacter sp. 5516J-16]UOQ77160.1 hypothetical protein MUN84_22385 [Hymenobacter sp. 5516J-16]